MVVQKIVLRAATGEQPHAITIYSGGKRIDLQALYDSYGFMTSLEVLRGKVPFEALLGLVPMINREWISQINLIKLIEEITEIANITSLDLVDRITLIDAITNIGTIANLTSVGTVNLINTLTTLGTVNQITNIANVQSIDLIDAITAITNIANLASVDLIDRITLIDAITAIGTITTITGITNPINVKTSGATNIVLDLLTQGAYTERRSTLQNPALATPPSFYPVGYCGKFFPRGCRGFLRFIDIRARNTTGADVILTYVISPQPDIGEVFTVDITVPAGDDGSVSRYGIINKFWKFGSMFIYQKTANTATVGIGYDTTAPPDGFYSGDLLTWALLDARPYIDANMIGQTCGDIGPDIVNTIEIPSSASQHSGTVVNVPTAAWTAIKSVNGAGEMINARVLFINCNTTPDDDVYYAVDIYCDGVLAGYIDSRIITQSLVATSGRCCVGEFLISDYATATDMAGIHWHERFKFRRNITLRAFQSTGAAKDVYGAMSLNLLS